MKDWIVRVYDEDNKILASWKIENRTEIEAFSEAEADVIRIPHQKDWSLTPEGITLGNEKVSIEGE